MKQIYLQKLATKLVINISQNVYISTANDGLTNPGKTEMFCVDQAFFVIFLKCYFDCKMICKSWPYANEPSVGRKFKLLWGYIGCCFLTLESQFSCLSCCHYKSVIGNSFYSHQLVCWFSKLRCFQTDLCNRCTQCATLSGLSVTLTMKFIGIVSVPGSKLQHVIPYSYVTGFNSCTDRCSLTVCCPVLFYSDFLNYFFALTIKLAHVCCLLRVKCFCECFSVEMTTASAPSTGHAGKVAPAWWTCSSWEGHASTSWTEEMTRLCTWLPATDIATLWER